MSGSAARGARRRAVWFFDLDDTLHDASHAMFEAIDARMTDYVQERLRLDRAGANDLRNLYWRRYGATMLGLILHHGVDPHDFLHRTHDFDVAGRLRYESGLEAWFRRLAGRKVLLTNSPLHYAGRVLRGIGLHRHFDRRYAIESMRVHGRFRPKPARAMFRAMLARERLGGRPGAARAILVDDHLPNLKAARAVGYATVLVERPGPAGGMRRLPGAGYVDARVRSIGQLPALAAGLIASGRASSPPAAPVAGGGAPAGRMRLHGPSDPARGRLPGAAAPRRMRRGSRPRSTISGDSSHA
jgi:putative hydrolase of the HAD superfamily